MEKHLIEIQDLPEGVKVVAYRRIEPGETYWSQDHKIRTRETPGFSIVPHFVVELPLPENLDPEHLGQRLREEMAARRGRTLPVVS